MQRTAFAESTKKDVVEAWYLSSGELGTAWNATPLEVKNRARELTKALRQEVRDNIAAIPLDEPDRVRLIYKMVRRRFLDRFKRADRAANISCTETKKRHKDRLDRMMDRAELEGIIPPRVVIGPATRPRAEPQPGPPRLLASRRRNHHGKEQRLKIVGHLCYYMTRL